MSKGFFTGIPNIYSASPHRLRGLKVVRLPHRARNKAVNKANVTRQKVKGEGRRALALFGGLKPTLNYCGFWEADIGWN
jgi:hypothetical protein